MDKEINTVFSKGEAGMNRNYLKHEFLITSKSRRNIPFILFIGVLLLSYCLILLPNEETKETYYPDEVRTYLTELEVEQQLREIKGNTGIVLKSGMLVYAMNAYSYILNHALLTAIRGLELLSVSTFTVLLTLGE